MQQLNTILISIWRKFKDTFASMLHSSQRILMPLQLKSGWHWRQQWQQKFSVGAKVGARWTNGLSAIEKSYLNTLKTLLSVCEQTCIDLVFLELGIGSTKTQIQKRWIASMKKKRNSQDFTTPTFSKPIHKAQQTNSSMGKYLTLLDQLHDDPFDKGIADCWEWMWNL